MARSENFEISRMVLETIMLPLHQDRVENWLRKLDSNQRKMLMRHLSEPLDYPAIKIGTPGWC